MTKQQVTYNSSNSAKHHTLYSLNITVPVNRTLERSFEFPLTRIISETLIMYS